MNVSLPPTLHFTGYNRLFTGLIPSLHQKLLQGWDAHLPTAYLCTCCLVPGTGLPPIRGLQMLQAQPLSLWSFSTKDQPLLHFLCTHTGKDSTKASPTALWVTLPAEWKTMASHLPFRLKCSLFFIVRSLVFQCKSQSF